MVGKVLRPVPEVIDQYQGLSRRVLDWASRQKSLIDACKLPDFDDDRWSSLAEFVNPEKFQRVGTMKETMDFTEFLDFMREWAPTAHWVGAFKRITELDNVVILEMEERIGVGAINSISVYEFDDEGKLKHLDVYMQPTPSTRTPNPSQG